MQSSTLVLAKRRVRDQLLGTRGVHAVGLRTSSVVLYIDPGSPKDEILELARKAASPHDVVVVVEERPLLARPGQL